MPEWARHSWRALGSTAEVLAYGPDTDVALRVAVEEIERLEQCWSRFRSDSELSVLNVSDGRWFPASDSLWLALHCARQAFDLTGGLFDPTIHNRLVSLGYDRNFRDLDPSAVARPSSLSLGFDRIEFDDVNHLVRVPADLALDLGGIGKGLAADLVTDLILANGATSVCVSLGGDIRVGGPGPDEDSAWNIEVQHPVDHRSLGAFPLSDEALVQSTTLFRQWQHDGRTVHHLIDPRTGQSSDTDLIGAAVTGPRAWVAEVIAKTAILLGSTAGIAFLIHSNHDGWLMAEDGRIVATAAVAGDLERVPCSQ